MNDLKIAVSPHDLNREDYWDGLRRAADMGVDGVQIGGHGVWAPDKLDAGGRKELLRQVKSYGLVVSAISAGAGDLTKAGEQAETIRQSKRIIDLAADLDCPCWQAHCGVMPEDESDPRWQTAVDGAEQVAAYGEKVGVALCIETGPEPPWVLRRLLEKINSSGLAINFDPANLIIWPVLLCDRSDKPYDPQWAEDNFEPHRGAELLGPWVRHTHAKDALVTEDHRYLEVPLGQGWIDWPRYVRILKQAGYNGYFCIEREIKDPLRDIQNAIQFLRNLQV